MLHLNLARFTFLLAVSLAPCLAQTTPETGPIIQFQELEHDYGSVKQYTEVVHSFPFTNRGTEVLKIERIDSGCTCTMAVASATEIPPGGEAEIVVTFSTDLRAGKKKKTIVLYTNEKPHNKTSLVVYADVMQALTAHPDILDFGVLAPNAATDTKKVSLVGYAVKTAKIKKAISENPKVQVTLVGSDALEVKLLPGLPVGRLNQVIHLETDDPNLRMVPVLTVSAKVKGHLEVAPQLVDFDVIASGSSQEKEVLVKSSGKTPFKILSATPSDPFITTRIETVTAGSAYKIWIKASQSFNDAKVTLTTDDPAQKELAVTLFGKTKSR